MKEHHHKSKNNLLLALDSNRRVLKKEFYKAKTTAVVQGKSIKPFNFKFEFINSCFQTVPAKKGGGSEGKEREGEKRERREGGRFSD